MEDTLLSESMQTDSLLIKDLVCPYEERCPFLEEAFDVHHRDPCPFGTEKEANLDAILQHLNIECEHACRAIEAQSAVHDYPERYANDFEGLHFKAQKALDGGGSNLDFLPSELNKLFEGKITMKRVYSAVIGECGADPSP